MKIIDIINKIANGTLEDGFKFKYDSDTYRYNKEKNEIRSIEYDDRLVGYYKIEIILNNEVEVIEENKEIEELPNELINDDWTYYTIKFYKKINELVRAVNKINKERECE